MDFLVTPYPWVLYEDDSLPCTSVGQSLRLWLWSKQVTVGGLGAIALLLTASQLRAETFSGRGIAYIAPPPGYNVNIRSGPSTGFRALNTLRVGTPVTLTGRYSQGWAELADGSWVAGNLISGSAIAFGGSGSFIQPGVVQTAYIATPLGYNLNLRSGPGTQFPAVNTLSRGTQITLTGRLVNGWAELTNGSWAAANWLQVGQVVTQPTLPTPQPPIVSVLQLGSRGSQVLEVERRLLQLGYFTSNFVPDTYFGTDTQQAVRNFQQLNRLPIDGIVGPQTRNVLFSSSAIANGRPTNPNPPNTGTFRIRTDDGQSALVFSGPGTENELLGFLDNGTQVQVTGRTSGNWSELTTGGWIYSDWLEPL
jgi:uncharacterized protein YraI